MPTNLPHDAKKKWTEVTLTKNPETKLKLMHEFLSLVPKHKGTEKMCKQVKRQISQLKETIEKQRKQEEKIKGSGPSYYIQKAGAAQIAILGPPNVGRSSLLQAVTNSQVEVTAWPYSTMMPTPGMLPYEDIQIQLVEIPPIVEGSSEGKVEGFMNLSSARNADGLIIMVDLNDDPIGNFHMIKEELEATRLLIEPPQGSVEIIKRGHGNDLQFIMQGKLQDCTEDDITQLLKDYNIITAIVKIKGTITLDTVEDSLFGNAVYRPTLIIGNKKDLNPYPQTIKNLKQTIKPLTLTTISTQNTPNLTKKIGKKIFNLLQITRIYTKERQKGISKKPIICPPGTTVGQLAKTIHNDFYNRFKYARIWGPAAKFDNEKVGLDRILQDGTTIQIYT